MSIFTGFVYLFFIMMMGAGLFQCWSGKGSAQCKLLWSLLIVIIPAIGTVFFWLYAEPSRELFDPSDR